MRVLILNAKRASQPNENHALLLLFFQRKFCIVLNISGICAFLICSTYMQKSKRGRNAHFFFMWPVSTPFYSSILLSTHTLNQLWKRRPFLSRICVPPPYIYRTIMCFQRKWLVLIDMSIFAPLTQMCMCELCGIRILTVSWYIICGIRLW